MKNLVQYFFFISLSLVVNKGYSQWDIESTFENLSDVLEIKAIRIDEEGNTKDTFFISKYKDGNLVQTRLYKNDSITLDETFEITTHKNKKIIKRQSTNPKRNTTTVEYYDKKNRLKKSLCFNSGEKKPRFYYSKMKYDKNDKLIAFTATSVQKYMKKKVKTEVDYIIEYPTPNTISRKTINADKRVEYEIRIEYDSSHKYSVSTITNYSYTYLNKNAQHKNNFAAQPMTFDIRNEYVRDTIVLDNDTLEVLSSRLRIYKEYDDRGNFIYQYIIYRKGKRGPGIRREIIYKNTETDN